MVSKKSRSEIRSKKTHEITQPFQRNYAETAFSCVQK